MNIEAIKAKNTTYSLSHFNIGDLCMGAQNGCFYLVVESENDKKQLIDLTNDKIIRVGTSISLIPCKGTLKVTNIG